MDVRQIAGTRKVSYPRRQFSPPAAAYANDAIILSLGARKCSAQRFATSAACQFAKSNAAALS